MKTRYKYIHFVETRKLPKTKVYACVNNNSNERIGLLKWHGAWRQYCFFPEFNTVYSLGCLNDIAEFMRQLRELT